MSAARLVALALALHLALPALVRSAGWDDAREVTKDEIVSAMRDEQRHGYALDAISNAVRLQAGVFLTLASAAMSADAAQRPLRIGHREYFEAFLEVTGHTPGSAPTFAAVPHRFGEDFLVDYRPGNVIAQVERGTAPRRVLNVKAGWPASPDAPARYAYEDRSGDPHLEAAHDQVNGYRVLDFGGVIVYDDMHGITGRATSGVLGFIFRLLGEAEAVQTRFAVAGDGTQVSRTTARKIITLTHTVTIFPDGKVLSGLPENRPDLEALEARLIGLDFRFAYTPRDLTLVPPRR